MLRLDKLPFWQISKQKLLHLFLNANSYEMSNLII